MSDARAGSLKKFVDAIFTLNPPYLNNSGTGLPGMNGTYLGTQGAANSAAAVMQELRQATSQFVRAIQSHGSQTEVDESMQIIEGSLLTLQILGGLDGDRTNQLISNMYDLAGK